MEHKIDGAKAQETEASDISIFVNGDEGTIEEIKVKGGGRYKMDYPALHVISEIGRATITEIILKAQTLTEERNGETISLVDVVKAMGMNDEEAMETIKEIERGLEDAKARNED